MTSDASTSACEAFALFEWTLVIGSRELTRQTAATSPDAATINQRLAAGESPREILGWTSQRVSIEAIRSVEVVPELAIVLVRHVWWRDPWRLKCFDQGQAERLFQELLARLPATEEPRRARISPQDLPMDPRLGLGVFVAFVGLLTILLGAIEGAGNAPIMGPARRFQLFAELGETIGVVPALVLGAVALGVGIGALEWWRRHRPDKIVVAARRP